MTGLFSEVDVQRAAPAEHPLIIPKNGSFPMLRSGQVRPKGCRRSKSYGTQREESTCSFILHIPVCTFFQKIMKKHLLYTFLYFLVPVSTFTQVNWYVGQTGEDLPDNGLSLEKPFGTVEYATTLCAPGDTINLLAGTYYNKNYGDGDIWKDEKTISLANVHGKAGADVVIRPNPGDHVRLLGDGIYIFHIRESSFIRVVGFEIEGEVDRIPLDSALAYQFVYKDAWGNIQYRVPPGTPPEEVENMVLPVLDFVEKPNYFDTKGLLIQNSHHIVVEKCHIHHTPGTGLRTNGCDYIWFIGNEINDCSRRSSAGTHALVMDSSESIDEEHGYKIFILGNEVHHNYNEIYSWSKNKPFITPVIDEGKGISMQRNTPEDGWTHGRVLIANNITYRNGFSGVHSNNGARMDFIHNTAYHNSFSGRGNNIGISLQRSRDIRIMNNISVTEPGMTGSAISLANSTDVTIENNLVGGILDSEAEVIQINTLFADPRFENAEQMDFSLKADSPAIGIASPVAVVTTDFFGNPRDHEPDLGAVEYLIAGATKQQTAIPVLVFPNPATDQIRITGVFPGEICRILDLSGQTQWELQQNDYNPQNRTAGYTIPASAKAGQVYFIVVGKHIQKLVLL
jgi:hypothetical protein